MKTLMSGGTTMRAACGRTMSEIVCPKAKPRLRAASACPTCTPLMPERTASATKGDVYAVRPITASTKKSS